MTTADLLNGQGEKTTRPPPPISDEAPPPGVFADIYHHLTYGAEAQPSARGLREPGTRGGFKRRRIGGRMDKIGGGNLLVPKDLIRDAGGFRFPIAKATPKQSKAFDQIVAQYIRRSGMYTRPDLSADLHAAVYGMSPRHAAYMLKEVRSQPYRPESDLALAILHGMLANKIAGVHGTRKNAASAWVFSIVDSHDPMDSDVEERLAVGDDGEPVSDGWWIINTWGYKRLYAAFQLDYVTWRSR
jgi:hypothetical protein